MIPQSSLNTYIVNLVYRYSEFVSKREREYTYSHVLAFFARSKEEAIGAAMKHYENKYHYCTTSNLIIAMAKLLKSNACLDFED